LELGCIAGVSFLERVEMGLYDVGKGLKGGDRVRTPLGIATVSQMRYCNIVGRLRIAVYLDVPQANGARLAAFDVWQVERQDEIEQVSLW
jgi:hypothetical protein